MGYYINLEQISIEEYAVSLHTAYLPPSRKILKDKPEELLSKFKSFGIFNLFQLKAFLNKKANFQELIEQKHFEIDYLTILLREINSILPKPNNIRDFNKISTDTLKILESIKVKNTFQLFDYIKDKKSRDKFSKAVSIPENEIELLARYCDLSRIKWVSPKFAEMLIELGIDCVPKAASACAEELHKSLLNLNKDYKYFKGNIGLNDIRIFVSAAAKVPIEVEL